MLNGSSMEVSYDLSATKSQETAKKSRQTDARHKFAAKVILFSRISKFFTLKKVNFFQKTEKICTFILNYLYIYKNCCIFARYFEFNGCKTLNG